MDDKGFIKFIRESKEFDMLVLRRPSAFVLLSIIAKRAKRSNDHPYPELEMGEALIGDYKTYGVSEQIYRTDKDFLRRFNFATFKPTSKGTIAKLINSSVFDINIEGEQRPNQRTKEQAINDRPTTNKNVKNNAKDNITGNLEKNKKVGLTPEGKVARSETIWSELNKWSAEKVAQQKGVK